ncbi:hypothetical protein QQ045_033561 [Rhodiola kirilowii]
MMEAFGGEVYDAEVVGSGLEEEMVAVLQVAMKCVEVAPKRRPEMREVVKMLEMVASSTFQSLSNCINNISGLADVSYSGLVLAAVYYSV